MSSTHLDRFDWRLKIYTMPCDAHPNQAAERTELLELPSYRVPSTGALTTRLLLLAANTCMQKYEI